NWEGGKSWDTLRIGFDRVGNEYISYENPDSKVCNGVMGCYPGNNDGLINLRKATAPEPLTVNFSATDSIEINNGTTDSNSYQTMCGSTSSICSYDEQNGSIYITLKKDLKSLSLNAWAPKPLVLRLSSGRKIESLSYTANSNVLFPYGANVYFKTISGSGSATFTFEGAVQLFITDNFSPSNPLMFNYIEDASTWVLPIIYGPRATFLLRAQNELRAFIVAKRVDIPNPISMEGAIT
ncbi:hypothetical protein K6U51_12025, partial [Vibrio fluvialis]|nr:hypothetical protein [Vibrio fluvialis]